MHRKESDAAHNAIFAYLSVILGAVFLVGGLLETIIVAESPRWFLLVPYKQSPQPSGLLGLILTILGFVLVSSGGILVFFYDRKRTWYLNQLEESSVLMKEKEKLSRKSQEQILEEIEKRYSKD